MPLMVYLDETGDHSMELIDRGYPVFGVVMVICDSERYINEIVPHVCKLKFDFFGHEGTILHSRADTCGVPAHGLRKEAKR